MNSEERTVQIVADDREPAAGVIAELERIDGVRVLVRRLAAGDYLVDNRFAVERKTFADFGQSLVDGRLFAQAARLAAGSARAVLILEGPAEEWDSVRVGRESLQGAVISLGVFMGVAILRAEDAAETARLLIYLGSQARRSANGSLPRSGRRPKRKRARQLYFLQGLPGGGTGARGAPAGKVRLA